jgi:hypothetical protein
MNVSQGTQDILDISFGESYIDDGELLSNCLRPIDFIVRSM